MNWFTSLFNKLVRFFKGFMKIAFPIVKQIIIASLKDFAVATVSELEKTDLSNEARRREAFNRISMQAKVKGIQVSSSLIFCIIEIALQYIKEKS